MRASLKPGYGYRLINGEWETIILPEWALSARLTGTAEIDGARCDLFEAMNPAGGRWRMAQTEAATRSE